MRHRAFALLFIALCVFVGCTPLPTAPPAPGWPTHSGGEGSASEQPAETLINPSTVNRLHAAWTFTPSPTENLGAPLVSGSTVVTQTYQGPLTSRTLPVGQVHALQLSTGKTLWSRSFPRQIDVGGIWQGVVVVTLYRMYSTVQGQWPYSVLVGLSLKTGAVVWSHNAPADDQDWEAPVIVGGGHLFTQDDQGVVMLDAATGNILHQFSYYFWNANAAYGNGHIFTEPPSTLPGPLGSWDASTGVQTTTDNASSTGADWGQPIVYNNRVYAAEAISNQPPDAGQVAAFPANGCGQSNCFATWKTYLPERILNPPTAENGKVFTVGSFGSIFALDANTGKLIWEDRRAEQTGYPSTAGGVLFVTTVLDQLQAFNEAGCGAATCSPIFTIGNKSTTIDYFGTFNAPVIADGYVLYETSTGLHADTTS